MIFETVRIASTQSGDLNPVAPQLAIAPGGPIVAWAQQDGIFIARHDHTWQPAERVRDGAAGVRIAANGGRVWAIWDTGGTLAGYGSYSEDGVNLEAGVLGEGRLVAEQVATQLWIHCYGSKAFALAVGADGEPRAAYVVRDRVWHARRSGGTWTNEKGPLAERDEVAFAIDARGRSHVVFVRDGILRHACQDGGRWQETKLVGDKYEGRHASIATDAAGTAHVAYMNATKSKDQLWYARVANGAVTNELVDKKGNCGFNTRIAVDAKGTPWIAYRTEHSRENGNMRVIKPAEHRIATKVGATWQVSTVATGGCANDFVLAERPYIVFAPELRGDIAVATTGETP